MWEPLKQIVVYVTNKSKQLQEVPSHPPIQSNQKAALESLEKAAMNNDASPSPATGRIRSLPIAGARSRQQPTSVGRRKAYLTVRRAASSESPQPSWQPSESVFRQCHRSSASISIICHVPPARHDARSTLAISDRSTASTSCLPPLRQRHRTAKHPASCATRGIGIPGPASAGDNDVQGLPANSLIPDVDTIGVDPRAWRQRRRVRTRTHSSFTTR